MHVFMAFSIFQALEHCKTIRVGLKYNTSKPTEDPKKNEEGAGKASQHKYSSLSIHLISTSITGMENVESTGEITINIWLTHVGGMNTWNHKPPHLLKIMSEKWEGYSVSWEIQRYH